MSRLVILMMDFIFAACTDELAKYYRDGMCYSEVGYK
jgi:hypothetical protein